MTDLNWEDVPTGMRDALAASIGPIVKAEPTARGIMPGVTARLHIEGGHSVFFKAVPSDSPAAPLYEREMWAGSIMPSYVLAPRMRWARHDQGWLAVAFEYIDNATAADLTPRSPHVPRVLSAVNRVNAALTPAPDGAPSVLENVKVLQAKAAHMMTTRAGMLGDDLELYREALDGFDPAHLVGTTMLHYDLHAGNLLITTDRVHVIDWSFACQGATWVDLAMLAPRLIHAGHTPRQVEQLLAGMSAWVQAPAKAINGLAALWTLFRVYKAQFGPSEVRGDRALAAQAGRAWVAHRLG